MTSREQDRPDPADDAVDELLAQCLSIVEHDAAQLESFLAQHPEHAEVLRRRLELLRSVGLGAPARSGDFPERLGDFRLLRRLGGGGMGEVFLAEQLTLGRHVALKLIRPEQLYFPGARARFQREAQAVARLSHPGIAQIHTVGEAGGLPYLAMELVDGAALGELLAWIAAQRRESPRGADLLEALEARGGREHAIEPARGAPFDLPWRSACAWIARELAQALEHAHQRGVVHRDVKPSNVMLTRDGRVLLVDFGLATASGVDALTRTGAALGSLPYMAPEQIEGRVDDIGPRTDVYGLGVTLYEMLSLRRPFEAPDQTRLRAMIVSARAPRLTAAPRDLAAVVEAAMAPEQRHRYASAADLARDLSHVLSGEPIEARRASPAEQAWSWARRNPAHAVASGLAAVIVLGGPLVFGVIQSRAADKERELREDVSVANQLAAQRNLELERANDELERRQSELARALEGEELQRGAAVQNLEYALDAVDTMLTRVGATKLEDVPQMEGVRRELLEDALSFYERFVAQREGDAQVRFRSAVTERKVSVIREELGDLVAARASAEGAVERMRALEAEGFESEEFEMELVSALCQSGSVLLALQQFDHAEQMMREAIARMEPLGREPRHARFVRRQRPVTYQQLAFVLRDSGRVDEALAHSRQGLDLLAADSDDDSVDARSLHDVGTAALSFAVMRQVKAPAREAEAAHLEALALLRRASDLEPEDPRKRESLASALGNLGLFLSRKEIDDRFEPSALGAESALREAVGIYRELIERFPLRALYSSGLTSSSANLCVHLARTKRMHEAREFAELSLGGAKRLVELAPQSADHRSKLCATLNNVAKFELADGRAREALELLDEAERQLEIARGIAPSNAAFAGQQRPLGIARVEALLALEDWRRGFEALDRFDERNPDRTARRWSLDQRCALLQLALSRAQGDDLRAVDDAVRDLVGGLRLAVESGRDAMELARSAALAPLCELELVRAWLLEVGAIEE